MDLPQSSKKTTYIVKFGDQALTVRKPRVKDYPYLNKFLSDWEKPMYEIALDVLSYLMVAGKTSKERRLWLDENVEFSGLKEMDSAVIKLLQDLGLSIDEKKIEQEFQRTLDTLKPQTLQSKDVPKLTNSSK